MDSGFIIAFIYSVNIHKNRIFFFIRKKKLQGFVLDMGGMRKTKPLGLVQEGGLCKFPIGILLEKTR